MCIFQTFQDLKKKMPLSALLFILTHAGHSEDLFLFMMTCKYKDCGSGVKICKQFRLRFHNNNTSYTLIYECQTSNMISSWISQVLNQWTCLWMTIKSWVKFYNNNNKQLEHHKYSSLVSLGLLTSFFDIWPSSSSVSDMTGAEEFMSFSAPSSSSSSGEQKEIWL